MIAKDRINKAYEHLRYIGAVQSQKDLATKLNANYVSISRALKGDEKYLTETLLERFDCVFGNTFNSEWLLTGESEMLKQTEMPVLDKDKDIPYFDIETIACGSFIGFGQGLEKGRESGYMNVPQIPTKEGDFFIQAQGRSMIDVIHTDKSISNGAWVCIREWKASYIQWGEIYAIATREGYVIKRILPSERGGCIKCVSSNETEGFYPYDLDLANDVIGIAKVIGVANFKVF